MIVDNDADNIYMLSESWYCVELTPAQSQKMSTSELFDI